MIIKKYQGKTEAEAVDAAQKELGSGVVIMSVRSIRRKGLFGFLLPQLIEVTAALEEENENRHAPAKKAPVKPAPAATPAAREDFAAAQQQKGMESNTADASSFEPIRESDVIEEKLDSLHDLLEKQLRKPEEETRDAEQPAEEPEGEFSRFLKLVYNAMLDNEVDEAYANQLLDALEKNNRPDASLDQALADVYQKMILKFGKTRELTPAKQGPKVVFFVGPTGVGKTTTIAKIASKMRLEKKKKIALLTADTYRIAAAEQLRTYANILEVPCRVVYSAEEIVQATEDFADYDYIMVDTAGHSHHNEELKEAIRDFVHAVDDVTEKEVYLVLSAATKYKDLVKIADAYQEMTEYKLIFTKLDETDALGNLFNIRMHTGAEMSYVTYGQNVPDDMEIFHPQKTVKLLLGGKRR